MTKEYQDLIEKRRSALLNYDKKQHREFLDKQDAECNSKPLTYKYRVILIDHLNWEIRDQYMELLTNYIEDKISTENFHSGFLERYETTEKVANLLELNRVLLSPDKNSLDFAELLAKIDDYCTAYCGEPEFYESGPDEFPMLIKKIYLEIQKYLNEE